MILAIIGSALLFGVGALLWRWSRQRSRLSGRVDAALYCALTFSIGLGVYYFVLRTLNYAVIMENASDPAGFAAGAFAGLMFLFPCLAAGSFLAGLGLLFMRRNAEAVTRSGATLNHPDKDSLNTSNH